MMRSLAGLFVAVVLVVPSPAHAASALERQLALQLNGAWVVLEVETYSECSGTYSNTRVHELGVTSKASRRFAPGELAKIDKINLKRSRLDLFLSFEEPVLLPRWDGPFELFDERVCKVQLMVELPRDLVREERAEAIVGRVLELAEIYGSLDEARGSASWNHRQRRPYPPDYELTLARHAVWRARQANASVDSRSHRAAEEAFEVLGRLRDGSDYLAGFAAGVEKMQAWREDDCADLVVSRFESVRSRSRGDDRSSAWKDGYRDGQELAYDLLLAHRLNGCFVPVPPDPDIPG